MKFTIFLVFVSAIGMTGCGTTTITTTNVSNSNVATTANTNVVAPPATNSGLETTKKREAETTNNAPTLGPVAQTYYEALKKKDDALLKTVIAQSYIKSLEADMKEEKKTGGLAAYLASIETMPDKPVEVRNEKIEGNQAVAELKGGVYLNWTPLEFINEGGKWKFTGGSPVLK